MAESFTAYEQGLDDKGLGEKANLAPDKQAATTKSPATPLRAAASPQPTAPAGAAAYPLIPTQAEERAIQQALTQVDLAGAEQEWPKARKRIGGATGATAYLGFNTKENLFEKLYYVDAAGAQNILRDVLFVALRYRWNADEVLALWQNEGLPAWVLMTHLPHASTVSPMVLKQYYSRPPGNDAEAKVFARSAVLFQWWGLDVLTPVTPQKVGDNKLDLTAGAQVHDQVFNAEFGRTFNSVLGTNPIRELTDYGTTIAKSGGNYTFHFNPAFQSTLLALQHARFKALEAGLPKSRSGPKGATVALDPPFPALIYLYFNSKFPDVSVGYMTAGLKPSSQRHGSTDLYKAFLTTPLPKKVEEYLHKHCGGKYNCHGYMNALRFEYLRRIYATFFNGINTGSTPRNFPIP
jgi:hypothetical protein